MILIVTGQERSKEARILWRRKPFLIEAVNFIGNERASEAGEFWSELKRKRGRKRE